MANEMAKRAGKPAPHDVFLVAERDAPLRCAKGMRVLPDTTTAQCRSLDVLLVPGGQGTRREVGNAALLGWIAEVAATAKWVTSVCTGALLLTAAGPAKGRRVTTHWGFVETLRAPQRSGAGAGRLPLRARRQCGDRGRRPRPGSTWRCGWSANGTAPISRASCSAAWNTIPLRPIRGSHRRDGGLGAPGRNMLQCALVRVTRDREFLK